MNQKLEDRLHLYEQDHPIRDDQELTAAIDSILNEQDSLPIEERDFDLISEATDVILKLQGYNEDLLAAIADEAVNSLKTRIRPPKPSSNIKSNSRPHIFRWLIPVVAVLSLTTIAVFASPANRLAISDMTSRIYSSFKPMTVYHEDNIDLVISDDTTNFSSFDELSAAFGNSILLPFDLEEELKELSIEVANLGYTFDIYASFKYRNSICYITIVYNLDSDSRIETNPTIGEQDLTINNFANYVLAEWTYKNIYYQVKCLDKNSVESIVKYMRFKNE